MKQSNILRLALSVVVILGVTLASACTGATTTSTGSIEVRVTDAPSNEDVTGVMVTVTSVEIHQAEKTASPAPTATATKSPSESESGWLPMKLSGANTFDLLQIKGLEQVLATGDIAAGTYTQIRMQVSKIQVTFKGGTTSDAKVPSGKLKFVQSFDVAAGKPTVLLFDFDAAHSINVTGNGTVMFKPVIKLTVTRTPGVIEITTPSLPNGEVGTAYNATLTAIGGKAPYTWSVTTGSLPAGLSLNATTGAINGSPTAAGDVTFTAKIVDSSTVQKNGTRSFTVNIAAAGALQITTTNLPEGMRNVAYTATVHAVGGTTPYTWSVSSGSLPGGLTIDTTTGVISGTPTANGDFTFTVKSTDSASTPNADIQNLAIHVNDEVSD